MLHVNTVCPDGNSRITDANRSVLKSGSRSISPATRPMESIGGVPVGLPDGAYLGDLFRQYRLLLIRGVRGVRRLARRERKRPPENGETHP